MERFVLQKYTFRFGLAIRFVLRIIGTHVRESKKKTSFLLFSSHLIVPLTLCALGTHARK